ARDRPEAASRKRSLPRFDRGALFASPGARRIFRNRAMPRLHVNVDHVATVRQARRGARPDPVAWALQAEDAGAQGIPCHLRQDRRHIQDADVRRLRSAVRTLLNLETSLDPQMLAIALSSGANAFRLGPEDPQG